MADGNEFDTWLNNREVNAPLKPVEPAPTPQTEDTFGQFLDQRRQNAATLADAYIQNAPDSDKMANAVRIAEEAERLGFDVPADMLTDPKSAVVRQIESASRRAQLMNSSRLSSWVVADPVNAALMKRDAENLSGIAATINAFGAGTDRAVTGVGYGMVQRSSENNLDQMQQAIADREKGIADIFADEVDRVSEARLAGDDNYQPFTGTLMRSIRAWRENSNTPEEDAREIAVLERNLDWAYEQSNANSQRIGQTYGTSAARRRGDEAVAAISALPTAGEQITALGEYIKENPGDFSAWLGLVVVESSPILAVGAATTALTKNPGAGAAAAGLTSGLMGEAQTFDALVREGGYDLSDPAHRAALVGDPEFRRLTRDRAFAYGATVGLMDGLSGGLAGTQLVKSVAGDMVLQSFAQAAMGSSGEALALLASGQQLNMVDVIVEGLAEFATAPLEVAGVGGGILRARHAARGDQAFFRALADGANSSQTKLSAPKKYHEAIDALTKDGPVESLYVDAQSLDELFQSRGESAADFLANLTGVDLAAFSAALDAGGNVEIPTASYAAQIAGTDFDTILREHLKTDPDRLSVAEVKALEKQTPDLMARAQATTEQQGERGAALEEARQTIVSALRTQGQTSAVAMQNAEPLVAFVATQAQRIGVTPEQYLERFPLPEIRGAFPTVVAGQMPAPIRAAMPNADPAVVAEALAAEGIDAATATPEEAVASYERYTGALNQMGEGSTPDVPNPPTLDTNTGTRRLPNLERMSPGPVAGVRELASRYMAANGMPVRHQSTYITVDVERAKRIADEYEKMESNPQDPEVKAAYDALVAETVAQYEALLELGMTFEFIVGEDPYASPRDAIIDMQENNHLWVFPTDDGFGSINESVEDNPLLAMTDYVIDGRQVRVNDLFRIVHDVFGHGSEGAAFGPRGEENAWQAHVRMFTPLAARAMTSETRGQNSWVNFGPYGEQNRADPKNTVFADQKVGLLPEWVSTVGQAEDIGYTDAEAQANFETWFSDSKVVDRKGEPRVMFHGTRADVETFFPLSHFGTARAANQRLNPEQGTRRVDDGARVVPVLLSIQNPLDLSRETTPNTMESWQTPADMLDQVQLELRKAGQTVAADAIRADVDQMRNDDVIDGTDPAAVEAGERAIAVLESLGYDGLVYENRVEDTGSTSFVAFRPEQVKSPFNTGRFNRRDPRILYQSGQPAIPTNADGTVTLTHWSDAPRDVITPTTAGTGPLRGAERNRRGPQKTFFGIGVGMPGGYRKENLGPYKHEARVPLTDLYNMSEDPNGFFDAMPANVAVLSMQRMGWVEEQVQAAGFKGYYVTSGPQGMSAALFEDVAAASVADDRMMELFQSGATPDFFSALTREVENAKQKKAGAKEWFAVIQKLPGVKKAEIEWSGVEAWLFAQEGQIAREDVAAFLRDNEVEVETVVRSGSAEDEYSETGVEGYEVDVDSDSTMIDEDEEYLREQGWDIYGPDLTEKRLDQINEERAEEGEKPLDELPDGEEDALRDAAFEIASDEYYNDPNYEYGVLITYPDGETVTETIYVYSYGETMWNGSTYGSTYEARDAIVDEYRDEARERAGGVGEGGGTKWGDYTETGGENYREVLLTVPNLQARGPNADLNVGAFVNTNHFDDPNIVVHARLNERLAANGDKVLFVEEVQSDLGSYWRERGGFDPQQVGAYEQAMTRAETAAAAYRDRRDAHWLRARELGERLGPDAASEIGGSLNPEDTAMSLIRAAMLMRETQDTMLGELADLDFSAEEQAFEAAMPRPGQDGYEDFAAWSREDSAVSEAAQQVMDLREAAQDIRAKGKVTEPVTPFEGEAYYALMMKKLLKMAAEEGADRLAWTPAYMQARRWSGAVQNVVQEITWNDTFVWVAEDGASGPAREVLLNGTNGQDGFLVDDEGVIREKSRGGGRIPEGQVVGKNISELIGGVMAKRVMEESAGSITGENIVIGGDGYKISYDQQIKKFVEKFAKKYGGRVVVDKTMPDFANSTNSEPLARAVKRFGYANTLNALRASDLRSPEFWVALDAKYDAKFVEAEARVDEAIAENEAQIAEYEKQLAAIDPASETRFTDMKFLADKLARLQEFTENRYQEKRDFANPERRAETVYINLRRENVFTEKQIVSVLPEDALPQGDAVWSVVITDKMREAAKEAQPLYQRRPQGARGSILLPTQPGQAPVITLFEGADLSTFLHESGHYFLHVLQEMAKTGEVADWDAILNWWGQNIEGIAKDGGVTEDQVRAYLKRGTTGDVDIDRAVNVGLQEQWARAFETYLMEGNAPSNALRSAFEAFSSWLISVYRRVKGDLNVAVSDEIRGVFDRMLATDEEIAAASQKYGTDKLVADSAEALGVDVEEYAKLVRLGGEAQDEAKQAMLRAIMAPIRAERTQQYREERAVVEAEIAARVNAKPANRVREWLGNERWLGTEDQTPPTRLPLDLRMNRQSIIDDFGQDTLDALPRGSRPLTTNETSLRADDVAGWFGYKSGGEMLQDITTSPKASDEIKMLTKAEMRRRHGDVLTDGTIEAEAVAAIHGEKRGQLIAAELRALNKTARVGTVTTRSQAREIARRTISAMPIRKAVRSGQYLVAERRASERSQQAVAKGDFPAAYEAKREQLLNNALYMESKAADEMLAKVESRVAKLKSKGTRKNLAGEYLAAIDDILQAYDFRKSTTQRREKSLANLAAYIEMMETAGRGNELAIPDKVREAASIQPYRTLTMNELRGVYDSLVNIEHTARMKQKLRDAQNERDKTKVIDAMVASIEANVPNANRNRVKTNAEKRKDWARDNMNLLLSADTILRKLDGFERGAVYDAIKENLDIAAANAVVARQEAGEKFEELYRPYTKRERRELSKKTYHATLKGSFSKWDLISMALNMGNADNLNRLMDKDSGRGFNAAQVEYAKNQLDQRDWDFVVASWRYIDSFWPQIVARERRVTGVEPVKVVATEVTTPFGTVMGGYYPIKYDGDQSGIVENEDFAEILQNMQGGRFGKAQTKNGHLKERANGSGGRVLQLGIEVMHMHVGQVIHDLAFSEGVVNAYTLLNDPRVRAAFEKKGLLSDHRTLEVWLQDVAVGQIAGGGVWGKLAVRAKNNFTLSKLAFSASTVLLQLTGASQSAVVVGKKNLALGYSDYAKDPQGAAERIMALSPFMAERQTTFNRDIRDLMGDIAEGPASGRLGDAQQWVARWGFLPMQKAQFYGVDLPTWLAGYRQGMDKFGDDAKAILHADRMVARAQASGIFADRSAFERGSTSRDTRQNGFIRLFTTLGSYMFAKGNIAYEVLGKARKDVDGFNTRSLIVALSAAADMALLFTVEAIFYHMIKGTLPGGDDDDEASWGKFLARETVLSMMSTVPGIRDVGSAMSGFDAGAYSSIIDTVFVRPSVQIGQAEIDGPLLRSLSSATGALAGLPTGQLNRTVDAWYRLENGDDVAPIEFLMGPK